MIMELLEKTSSSRRIATAQDSTMPLEESSASILLESTMEEPLDETSSARRGRMLRDTSHTLFEAVCEVWFYADVLKSPASISTTITFRILGTNVVSDARINWFVVNI
jgi:hypothetical protein